MSNRDPEGVIENNCYVILLQVIESNILILPDPSHRSRDPIVVHPR